MRSTIFDHIKGVEWTVFPELSHMYRVEEREAYMTRIEKFFKNKCIYLVFILKLKSERIKAAGVYISRFLLLSLNHQLWL